ncbi:phage tail spike protein [Brochothrix thermosphacta]|uniref:phage tail spike protein n=1 Tax=Brochothrix thermosphacta TaxID=2756 RepID=UPI0039B108E2
MYYILNKNEKIIGVLNNDGKSCPFYDDHHENAIAESSSSDNGKLAKIWSETLSLSVPYGYDETDLLERGTQILFKDSNDLYKLFTIYEVTDEINGETHRKSIDAFNSCIWKMSHTQIDSKNFSSANSINVFSYIFERSGWTLDGFNDFYSGGAKSYEVTEGTAQAALDEALKEFDVEVVAYAVINDGNIIAKHVQLVERLGENTGERFEYRHNIKGASRKETETDFYTKLYVKGANKADGTPQTITSVNKVKNPKTGLYEYLPYLLDDEANDNYNSGHDHLEGLISNDKILQPSGLLTWGKEQLKYYNHPKFEYTVDVALLAERPQIGDKVVVVDFEMSPVMTVTARVVATNYSLSDVVSDNVTLGEFTTINAITPSLIWQLQANANQALQDSKDKSFRVSVTSQAGFDFASKTETKTLIAQVYEGNKLVTPKYPQSNFSWIKTFKDGTVDEDWTEKHESFGNILVLTFEDSDCTYECVFDNAISNAYFLESDFKLFVKLQSDSSMINQFRRVAQYAQVDPKTNNIYWSMGYSGYTAAENKVAESFTVTRTDMTGKILDRMFMKQLGHGSHFGLENIGGVLYVFYAYSVPNTNEAYCGKFKYTANKTYTPTSADIIKFNTAVSRINLDAENGYYLMTYYSSSKTVYRVFERKAFEKGDKKALHQFTASSVGISEGQTYQSSCIDYPYVYTVFGGAKGTVVNNDMPQLRVIDARTGEQVHQLNFNFTAGDIQADDEFHEPETTSIYYEGDSKYLLQGFAFTSEVSDTEPVYNKLYRLKIDNF